MIDNMDIATFNDRQLTNYRRHDVGFVFQFYNLIPNLSTLENVELATSLVEDGQAPEGSFKSSWITRKNG
jgi:putative ABC transport system ATP-binding protein